MNKILHIFLLVLLLGIAPKVWAENEKTVMLSFTKAVGATQSGNLYSANAADEEGNSWTVTSDGVESSFEKNKGLHFGTNKKAVQYIKLSTSRIAGTITKIVVNASTASGVTATVSTTVGGESFGGAAQSLSSTATDYTFTGSATGEIVVTITKPSSAMKALYVKSVAVTYIPTAAETRKLTLTFPETSHSALVLDDNFTATPTAINSNGKEVDTSGLNLSYSSSNTEVATVDATTGEVTIKGAGRTTITAAFAGNDTYDATSASYTLEIDKRRPVIHFEKSEIAVAQADAANFTPQKATVTPDGLTLTYSYSPETSNLVKKFDATTGTFTLDGTNTGTVTITATSTETADYSSLSESYTITVSEKVKQDVSIKFPQRSYTVEEGSAFTMPALQTTPEGLALTYTYTSSNEKVATVDATTGAVTVLRPGTTIITAHFAGNDDYNPVETSFTLTVTKKAVTGIEAPAINPGSGNYYSAQTVTITSSATDAIIYYTTDGSVPTSKSTRYTGSISVARTTTIKAIAVADGKQSDVASATIKILGSPDEWQATDDGTPSSNSRYYEVVWDKTVTSSFPVAVANPDSYEGKERKLPTGYVGICESSSQNTSHVVFTENPNSYYYSTYATDLDDHNVLSYLKFRTVRDNNGVIWEPVVHVSNVLSSYDSDDDENTTNYYKRIAITYVCNTPGDPLQYSHSYYPSSSAYNSGTYTTLPDGEVAVSLYKDGIKQVTDTTEYLKARYYYYGTSQRANRSYDDPSLTGTDYYGDYNLSALINENATRSDNQYFFQSGNDNVSGYYDNDYYNVIVDVYYEYRRTHYVPASTAESVVIPASTTIGGTSYNVTAIGYNTFNTDLWNITMPRYRCSSGSEQSADDKASCSVQWVTVPGHNSTLKNVMFELPSNVKVFAENAFSGCDNLRSIIIPNSVESVGTGAFMLDYKLSSLQYQTKERTDGNVGCNEKLTKIDDETFYGCTGLTSLEIPYGITSVGDYSLTYNFSLASIVIPNSMTTLGAHFLCCASDLSSLTIPASVTSINGAFLHGCESLKDVYLLGTASALDEEDENGNNTFGYNRYYCKGHVSNCTFHVPSDYYDGYAKDKVWSLIDEQGKDDNSTHDVTYTDGTTGTVTHTNANTLERIANETRRVLPDQWQTVIFPSRLRDTKNDDAIFSGYSDYYDANSGKIKFVPLTYFGENTLVAQLDGVAVDAQDPHLYHLSFKLIRGRRTLSEGTVETYGGDDWNKIPVNTVLLIKPAEQKDWTMFTDADQANEDFKLAATNDHAQSVEASDGIVITMKGHYVPYKTTPWDFYMISKTSDDGYTYQFRKVVDASKAATVKATRCWWRMDISGVKSDPTTAGAKVNFNTDGGVVTGIDNVEADYNARFVVDGIYDLNGRRVSDDFESLSKGIYVVNGKKVVKK